MAPTTNPNDRNEQVNGDWQSALELLADSSKRWLLVVGSHLGASNGVPLPFHQTAWSPSVSELVRYYIFQNQSREAALGIEQSLQQGKPPLGLIADTLHEQAQWLQRHTQQLVPQGPLLALAELAKHNMFQGIASTAYDNLFLNALSILQVPVAPCSLEQPQTPQGHIPFLREYDDRLFQDTAAHRQAEAQFLHTRLQNLLQDVDGIWLLGHPPYITDLFKVLQQALEESETLEVIWTQEAVSLSPSSAQLPPESDLLPQLQKLGPRAHIAEVNELGTALHEVAARKNISLSTWLQSNPPKGWTSVLDRTVDLRPILLYVPGLALFSELLKKLPRLSLKAVLSFLFLVLLLFSGLHYYEYRAFQQKMKPLHQLLHNTQKQLRPSKRSLVQLIQAEQTLQQTTRLWNKTKVPPRHFWILPLLPAYLKEQRNAFQEELQKLRTHALIPALFRMRTQKQLEEDILMERLGFFPEIIVTKVQHQKRKFKILKRKPFLRKYPLSFFKKIRYQALRSSNVMLLRVLMHKRMKQALQQGHQVFTLDLRQSIPLEDQLFQQAKKRLGYTGKHAALFQSAGLRKWLQQGKVTFVFQHIDTAGSIRRNLSRTNDLLHKFPRCHALITTYLDSSSPIINQHAHQFQLLQIQPYRFRDAREFLRKQTSTTFFEGAMANSFMRWNWSQPLVMAMLVEYYQGVGDAPHGLGVLYERLLHRMLSHQTFSTYRKFCALELLAYHSLSSKTPVFSTDQARRWLRPLRPSLSERDFTSLVQETIQQGVVRRQKLNQLMFVDPRFRLLFAARHLRDQSFNTQKSFLLRHSTLFMSFYVGVQPKVDRLVRSWIRDFQNFQAHIKKHDLEYEWLNPYFPSLVRAALAVHDGKVSADAVQQLESILFYWLEDSEDGSQFGARFIRLLRNAIDFLSTPSSKERILHGIANDTDLDVRLLYLTASSSSDIYELTVMRWLKRVRTKKDKRDLRHAYDEEKWKLPLSKRGKPNKLSKRFLISIKNALTTLIQIGSPSSLQFVMEYIQPETDWRFRPKTWFKIRYHVVKRMFSNSHFQQVLPFFARLATDDLYPWSNIFTGLYQTQSPKVARLLFDWLSKPSPAFPALLAWERIRDKNRKERTAHDKMYQAKAKEFRARFIAVKQELAKLKTRQEKRALLKPIIKLRNEIRKIRNSKPKLLTMSPELKAKKKKFDQQMNAKRTLVISLARFDKTISLPLFQKLFHTIKKGQDLRIYGAYGLSLMQAPRFFPEVKALIEAHFNKPKQSKIPKRWLKEQNQILSNSLVHFGTPEAFRVFQKLYNNKAWRQLNGLMEYQMDDFGITEMKQFALRRLLCSPKVDRDNITGLIRILGRIQTSANRRLLNRLLILQSVQDEPKFRKQVCQGKLLPYKTIQKRLNQYRLIEAIIDFNEPNDLPRLLTWMKSKNFLISISARYALRKSKHPASTKSLLEYALAHKYVFNSAYTPLQQTHRTINPHFLFKEVQKLIQNPVKSVKGAKKYIRKRIQRKRKKYTKRLRQLIKLLGYHSDWKTLLQMLPYQNKEPKSLKGQYLLIIRLQKYFRKAILRSVERLQGSQQWNASELVAQLPKPKTEPTPTPTRKTTPPQKTGPSKRAQPTTSPTSRPSTTTKKTKPRH